MKQLHWPIGAKLTAIILSVSGVALLAGLTVFTLIQMREARVALENSAMAQARLMALYAEVPLQFNDPKAIVDILSRTELPSLKQATVFDRDNKVYASYQRIEQKLTAIPDIRTIVAAGGMVVDSKSLQIVQAIEHEHEHFGYLYLNVSLDQLQREVSQRFWLMSGVAAALLFLSWILGQLLQKTISRPILRLTALARRIGETQDYSARASFKGDDEIASLSRSFNLMLDAIHERELARDHAEDALRESKKNLESAVQELQYLANYDSLTELPNRALCMDRIANAVFRAAREQRKAAVVFLDLDHFKEINDSLGHAVGDELLKAASRRLQSCIRRGDTLARLGGDEFLIVLEDLNEELNVVSVMQKIIDAFAHPFHFGGYTVTTTVSIGTCTYPQDGTDVQTLMRNADAAMYKAKELGRNTYQYYQPEMNALSLRRLSLVNDLRDAQHNGQLLLHFQPQIDSDSCRIIGVEALIRWQHPTLGPISPVEFIPVAETSGMIVNIGLWVINSAAVQLAQWRKQGYDKLRMAINLSAVQFRQHDLPEQISSVMQRFHIPHECIELEITESMLMRDVEGAIVMMKRLKSMGFRLAIDDFGTGYSSLNYLRKFPLDALKVDRSFVDEVTTDAEDTAITLAILSMAKNLRLTVIAEGVETREQFHFLVENGCDEVQGYLFSPPLPAEQLTQLLLTELPLKFSSTLVAN